MLTLSCQNMEIKATIGNRGFLMYESTDVHTNISQILSGIFLNGLQRLKGNFGLLCTLLP